MSLKLDYTEEGRRYQAKNTERIMLEVKEMKHSYGYPMMETKMAYCNALGDEVKALSALKEAFGR